MKRYRSLVGTFSGFVIPFLLLTAGRAQSQWPLEDVHVEHPLGSTFGEFQLNATSTGYYLHQGIDVLGRPSSDSTSRLVRVVVPGKVYDVARNPGSQYNCVTIEDSSGILYRYGHLDYATFSVALGGWSPTTDLYMGSGEPIAKIVPWYENGGTCEFHHVHYDIYDPATHRFLSPLRAPSAAAPGTGQVHPDGDTVFPTIEAVLLAQDDHASGRWAPFVAPAGSACTPVNGDVDVIVEARDENPGGSALTGSRSVWVHSFRWRACPDNAPDGSWQPPFTLDSMSADWGNPTGHPVAVNLFSTSLPWVSNDNYCVQTTFFPIVTNLFGGVPDMRGAWDTALGVDGGYTVSVELVDFAGNRSIRSARVCVQNGRPCGPELMIRDGDQDRGTLPYRGPYGWLSPDILVNDGTPNAETVREGIPNAIDVRVWNYGSADVPAGTPCTVTLGWGPPSPTLPATTIVATLPVTFAGDWAIGDSQIVPFSWKPPSGTLPLGHACLKAWVETANDPINTEMAVTWDDNKAQRNITFAGSPPGAGSPPAAPPEASSAAFLLQPLPGVSRRRLEIWVERPGGAMPLEQIRLHVGPGLVPGALRGGRVVGGYEGADPPDGEPDPAAPCAQPTLPWREARTGGCTRIVGEIDTAKERLVLEDIEVDSPTRLRLEARLATGVLPAVAADVHVVEYGLPAEHQEVTPLGGLTIRFRR